MKHAASFRRHQIRRYERKRWVDVRGTTHYVQGYEPQVLSYLQSIGQGPFNTNPSSKPYSFLGKQHAYHPDACFTDTNGARVYLEVKSKWTASPENTRDYDRTLAKFRAMNKFCKDHGFLFIVAISNGEWGTRPVVVLFPTATKLRMALQKVPNRQVGKLA